MNKTKHPYPGKFIVFEGIDGSGKTTLVNNLSERLTQEGIPHITTHEPGGYISELKDLVVVQARKDNWDRRAVLYMFLADRYLHLQKVVIPALQKGLIVLCDRYEYSTLVYQGIDIDQYILDYSEGRMFRDALRPDAVVFLDCPKDESISRLNAKYGTTDHCDSNLEYHLMRKAYEELFSRLSEEMWCLWIDTVCWTPQSVTRTVYEFLKKQELLNVKTTIIA